MKNFILILSVLILASCQINSDSENNAKGWKSFKYNAVGISFQYPQEIDENYVSLQLPPVITSPQVPFECEEWQTNYDGPNHTQEVKEMDGQTYCVNIDANEIARQPGSINKDYQYTTVKENKTLVLTFSAEFPDCSLFNDDDRAECDKDKKSFDPDKLALEILNTVSF